MSYRVILSPDAKADFRAAIRWYFHIQLELSYRFRAEGENVLRRVRENPYQFPRSHKSTRKALLKRFPYAIYFSLNAERVLILAILHQRRFNPWTGP